MSYRILAWAALALLFAVFGLRAMCRRRVTLVSQRLHSPLRRHLTLRGGPAVLAGGGGFVFGVTVLGCLGTQFARTGRASLDTVPEEVLVLLVLGLTGGWMWQVIRDGLGSLERSGLTEELARRARELKKDEADR